MDDALVQRTPAQIHARPSPQTRKFVSTYLHTSLFIMFVTVVYFSTTVMLKYVVVYDACSRTGPLSCTRAVPTPAWWAQAGLDNALVQEHAGVLPDAFARLRAGLQQSNTLINFYGLLEANFVLCIVLNGTKFGTGR